MNLFGMFRRSNPGRELALMGAQQSRRKIAAVAQQIRKELGLPDDPRLA